MAKAFARAHLHTLQNILNDTSTTLCKAQTIWAMGGEIDCNMRDGIAQTRDRMGMLLAYFEEGYGFGMVDPHILGAIRGYENIAAGLAAAFDVALRQENAHDAR